MTIIDPRVPAGWVAFNDPLEGHVDSLYLDTKDLETTADGILCDSPAVAQTMAWLKPDNTPASPAEIDAEWHRVKAMRPGLVWSRYRVGGFLHLAPEELARVTLARLDSDVAILAAFWPAFASWPWQAQAAACALAWGVGPGSQRPGLTSADWPHFHADVARQDWHACAVSGQLQWTGNPGVRPRDLAVSALFMLAAGATWDEARAGWPAGMVAETADQALAGLGLPGVEDRAVPVGSPASSQVMSAPAVPFGSPSEPAKSQASRGTSELPAPAQDAPDAPAAQEPDVDSAPTPVTHGSLTAPDTTWGDLPPEGMVP